MNLNNKKGEIMAILGVSAVVALLVPGTIQKIKGTEGVRSFKQDGKLIWCKMLNKGNDYCDAQYK
jgi:hypothetical protein